MGSDAQSRSKAEETKDSLQKFCFTTDDLPKHTTEYVVNCMRKRTRLIIGLRWRSKKVIIGYPEYGRASISLFEMWLAFEEH